MVQGGPMPSFFHNEAIENLIGNRGTEAEMQLWEGLKHMGIAQVICCGQSINTFIKSYIHIITYMYKYFDMKLLWDDGFLTLQSCK